MCLCCCAGASLGALCAAFCWCYEAITTAVETLSTLRKANQRQKKRCTTTKTWRLAKWRWRRPQCQWTAQCCHAVAFVAKVAPTVIITVVFAFAIVVVVAVVAAKPPPVAFVKSFLTQCSCGLNAHFVVIPTNEKLRSCKFEGCCRFNHMSPLFTMCTYNTYIHIVIKSLKFQRAPNISLHFTSRGISAVKSFKRFFDDWNR